MALQKWSEYVGLGLAIAIIGLWLLSGTVLLATPLQTLGFTGIFAGICLRTFLHTGLFILAHDAMHGNLVPANPQLNQRVGQIAVVLYACLPYEYCRHNHFQHHLHPAQSGDPDFHDGINSHPFLWYCNFIWGYFSWAYFARFSVILLSLAIGIYYLFDIAYLNAVLFFLVPLFVSSVQLFFFGTYLPHGTSKIAKSGKLHHPFLSYIWSLISCYHFGVYHEEHHAFPNKSWFQLPFFTLS